MSGHTAIKASVDKKTESGDENIIIIIAMGLPLTFIPIECVPL